ncbi:hypothetical protein BV22DRAFT_404323 [Leucogyrophana mollusca]|uniref:Uncharacterized protein n=1 Tax=Leucogyrophana mollusca TaxID=85980 RepID=A0ACB8BJ63_9AGAM|nr:hypothetical protein BV22DRAFT_404323 [Leucogyrophana mollusca]
MTFICTFHDRQPPCINLTPKPCFHDPGFPIPRHLLAATVLGRQARAPPDLSFLQQPLLPPCGVFWGVIVFIFSSVWQWFLTCTPFFSTSASDPSVCDVKLDLLTLISFVSAALHASIGWDLCSMLGALMLHPGAPRDLFLSAAALVHSLAPRYPFRYRVPMKPSRTQVVMLGNDSSSTVLY